METLIKKKENNNIMTKEKFKNQILSRIQHLFDEAEAIKNKKPELAQRYVFIARKLSQRAKVKIPKIFKRRFCKHCSAYFIPGKNYRVRTTGKTITYTCKTCNKWMRFGYK